VTRYLSVAEVVTINAEVVRKFGGTHAIRDAALLDSAVARPQTGYDADIFEEAAALFESLSQNHPWETSAPP
jgi:death on curing protein